MDLEDLKYRVIEGECRSFEDLCLIGEA